MVLADSGFKSLAGNWKCVWGPAVKEYKSNLKPINTMFIAQSLDSPSVFVVAIAGTNFKSVDDWISEDFNIDVIKYWDSIVANIYDTSVLGKVQPQNTPFVSRATYRALYNLASLKDPSTQITALTFLKNVADTAKGKINLWTTGHSLGGTIAPTLALYLNDTKAKWCPNDSSNISINCLAAAGATPGNLAFSRKYYQELGNNTIRVWNSRDVAPHGFQENGDLAAQGGSDMLKQVDTIFKSDNIATPLLLKGTIDGIALVAHDYGYTQLYTTRDTEFTSGWYSNSDVLAKFIDSPSTFIGQPASTYPHTLRFSD